MKKERNVIFLDIDGVIQPKGKQDRFDHDLDKLCKRLAVKFNNFRYLEMDKYDLGAITYDWHKKAVERVRRLCIEGPAEIVISSDWRVFSPLWRLQAYFKLHDLDQFVTDVTPPSIKGEFRCGEVTRYIKSNPDIKNFVILDDKWVDDFNETYPDHFVYCYPIFSKKNFERALSILKE